MDKKKLLEKYHAGNCSEEQLNQIEQWIASSEIELTDLEDHQELEFALEETLSPSKETDTQIQELIAKKKATSRWPWFLAGIVILSLLSSLYLNSRFDENTQGQETTNPALNFASELEQSSSSNDKIRLVSSETLNIESDSKIIDALLFTLNNDKSTNVRLACVQTLSEYAELEKVRTGLVNAITNQKSAMVLNNIAEALNRSGNTISKDEFEDRINKNLPEPLMQSIEENFIKI